MLLPIEPILYIDPQAALPACLCECCGRECYAPSCMCPRCERGRS